MVCTLAVVLPAAFVFGITARRTIPLVKPVDIKWGVEPHTFGTMVWSDPNGWPGKRISTSLWTDARGSLAAEFMFDKLLGPDVLVYWVSDNTVLEARLPDNAQLLGPFSNREKLPFPGQPRSIIGRFLLYSLANHEVIARCKEVTLKPK